MLHVFVCFNPISYHIAQRVLADERPAWAIVIFEARRVVPDPEVKAWHLPFTKRSSQWLYALSKLGLITRACVPHMKLHDGRLIKAIAGAKTLAYIDDGLDTLRKQPRNLNPSQIKPGSSYYTFEGYAPLPSWLGQLSVKHVGDLAALARPMPQTKPFDEGQHVLIESPGLDVAAMGQALIERGIKPIIVEHPAPEKQGPRPQGAFETRRAQLDLDAAIACSKGVHFYIGESMTLVIPLYDGAFKRNHWHVSLTSTQQANLAFAQALVESGHVLQSVQTHP